MKYTYICAGCGRFRFNRDHKITWDLDRQARCSCGSKTVKEAADKPRSVIRYRRREDRWWRFYRRLAISLKGAL